MDTHKSRWLFFAPAGRPLGMVKLSPDTQMYGTWNSGHLYNGKHIRAFSHIHGWQVAGAPAHRRGLPVGQGPTQAGGAASSIALADRGIERFQHRPNRPNGMLRRHQGFRIDVAG
ncbi:MAG: hypothetical protein C0504_05935 [Candidatus Solibacter sp.]|nr:hypothetical protein [Candidatus Solibacter sp.]